MTSEMHIIPNNWYNIPKWIKVIILLNYSTSCNWPNEIIKEAHTDVFGGYGTLCLIEITVLKAKKKKKDNKQINYHMHLV